MADIDELYLDAPYTRHLVYGRLAPLAYTEAFPAPDVWDEVRHWLGHYSDFEGRHFITWVTTPEPPAPSGDAIAVVLDAAEEVEPGTIEWILKYVPRDLGYGAFDAPEDADRDWAVANPEDWMEGLPEETDGVRHGRSRRDPDIQLWAVSGGGYTIFWWGPVTDNDDLINALVDQFGMDPADLGLQSHDALLQEHLDEERLTIEERVEAGEDEDDVIEEMAHDFSPTELGDMYYVGIGGEAWYGSLHSGGLRPSQVDPEREEEQIAQALTASVNATLDDRTGPTLYATLPWRGKQALVWRLPAAYAGRRPEWAVVVLDPEAASDENIAGFVTDPGVARQIVELARAVKGE